MTSPLAERLAARTLELVDVASESRDEARLAAHVLEVLGAAGVAVHDAGDTCLVAGTASAANARSCCSPAISTPCPRRATGRAASRATPCSGSARPT